MKMVFETRFTPVRDKMADSLMNYGLDIDEIEAFAAAVTGDALCLLIPFASKPDIFQDLIDRAAKMIDRHYPDWEEINA